MSRGEEAGRHDAAQATARALGFAPEELEERLRSAAEIDAFWVGLSPPERAVLGTLAELGGAAPPSRTAAEVAAAAEDGLHAELPAGAEAAAIAAEEALEALWDRGLVQRDRSSRDAWLLPPLGTALVARRVRELEGELERAEPAPPPAPDEHALLCTYSLLRGEPLTLTRAGKPHRRELDRLEETLAALLPPGGAEALLTELRRNGLLRLSHGALRTDETAAGEWARLGRRERAARLLHSEWGSPDAPLLLRQLRVLADRRWPEALSRCTLRRLLLRSGDEDPGQAGERHERAVSVLVSAGLLARESSGPSLALTPLGRRWPEPAEEVAGPTGFHLGNDLSVLVPRGLSPAVHLRVSRAARLDAGDVVARYRLDREAVLAALDGGEHPDELLAFLESRAEPRLPDPVRDDLRRWCERFGEVSAHEGIAVTCESAARREEFAAVVGRSELGVRLIAPGVAILAPSDHAAFLDELTAAGFTPRRSVLPARPGAGRGRPAGEAVPLRSAATAALEWASLPAWDGPAEAGRGRRATPPPTTALARIKDKYRREFGRSELAALDELEVEDLLEMEERGTIRRYLSGAGGGPRRPGSSVELSELEGGELEPTSPKRAAAVLAACAEQGRRCELAWRGEAGRRTVRTVRPLALLEEAGIRYARFRASGEEDERLVALDRILALRVISTRD